MAFRIPPAANGVMARWQQEWRSRWPPQQQRLDQLSRRFYDLQINDKLTIGFGVLVLLTFLVVGRSYLGSFQASVTINRTQQLRMPLALTSSNAQANLLSMMSNVRGYLATGESEYRDRYQAARQRFDQELRAINNLLAQQPASKTHQYIVSLEENYGDWAQLPNQLFALRNNLLANQPALRRLDAEGELPIAVISNSIQQMIQEQEGRSPSPDNTLLLGDMVDFRGSFALLVSSLRSYLVTQNPAFRFEYTANARTNAEAWQRLNSQRSQLTPAQQQHLNEIAAMRQPLLALPQSLFEIVEGDRHREDLYLFQTQAEPLADEMLRLLAEVVALEHEMLTQDLNRGEQSLRGAQWQTILAGLIALALGIAMTRLLRRQIADPIKRLTQVTERLSQGDLDARAAVESKDEIGTLALAFNQMTDHLAQSREALAQYSQTLAQRVEERTQELKEKNTQLKQTLEHLKQTQTQLIQTEKMSSLGQLVAGVAHEINNPVNFIHGNTNHASEYVHDLLSLLELYQETYPHPTPALVNKMEEVDLEFMKHDFPHLLASMKVGTERIREIVQSLRVFSRLDEAEVKEVDIHDGLDSTLMILRHRLKARMHHPEICIIKRFGEIPRVECYAGQLNQVFMNILSNAIDALDERDAARTVAEIEAAPSTITITTHQPAPDLVAIHIADNGTGIPPEVQYQLFDPFFTTKPVGKGTGLGMSISYKIVTEKHHGQLYCISQPECGAEFIIELPIRQPQGI
jgi:signal transduction histidine kinase